MLVCSAPRAARSSRVHIRLPLCARRDSWWGTRRWASECQRGTPLTCDALAGGLGSDGPADHATSEGAATEGDDSRVDSLRADVAPTAFKQDPCERVLDPRGVLMRHEDGGSQ